MNLTPKEAKKKKDSLLESGRIIKCSLKHQRIILNSFLECDIYIHYTSHKKHDNVIDTNYLSHNVNILI